MLKSETAKQQEDRIAELQKEIRALRDSVYIVLETAVIDAQNSYISGESHDAEGYLLACHVKKHQDERLRSLRDELHWLRIAHNELKHELLIEAVTSAETDMISLRKVGWT